MVKVGITGHRGLPAELAKQISILLCAELDTFDPEELVGVSCIADGADMLFADAVLARGGALEVIVPATGYRDALPEGRHADYDRIIARAATIHWLNYVESNSESHMAASRLMLGEISELVAVWDGRPSRAFGGTADVVDEARGRGIPVRMAWPDGAVRP
jgi:hypothetical protein